MSVSGIAAMTGHDRKTVRKYLREPVAEPRYPRRGSRGSKLDAHREYVEGRLRAGVWNAVVLLGELRGRGYTGGYTILKEYLAPKRREALAVAVRRFETAPGQQAQVDWGALGALEVGDGARESLSGFVFTLGASRAMFADVALDEQLGTLLRLHEAAFEALDGVPQEILYDNMRTVILGYDDQGEPKWHPVFLDFARYWGFRPRACRPYRPQTKGKVESGIKYLKRNFLCGREATCLEDLRMQLRGWTWAVANARVHGTTHRVIGDAWAEEREHLQRLDGRPPFPYVPEVTRRVGRDAYVSYGTSRYSVPWRYAGREVTVRQVKDHVEIWHAGERIADHLLCASRYQVQTVPAHHEGMPYQPSQRRRGAQLVLPVAAPQVEVRPLEAYETLVPGGWS